MLFMGNAPGALPSAEDLPPGIGARAAYAGGLAA